jgi:ketosteroid isomerase-like protein
MASMTPENVETIRGIYASWAQGDFTAGPEHYDKDLVFILRPEFADSGTYLGPEQVAGYMRGFLEPWDRLTIEATELIEARDSIVVAVTQRGMGTASGAETELSYFHVWTFRGSIIIRFETFMGRAEALTAVELDA